MMIVNNAIVLEMMMMTESVCLSVAWFKIAYRAGNQSVGVEFYFLVYFIFYFKF